MSLINEFTQLRSLRPPRQFDGESAEDTVMAPAVATARIYKNASRSFLMQKALFKQQAELGPHGELLILTGSHTGRAVDDKYVVHTEMTEKSIWWENKVKPMGEEVFEHLYADVLNYLHRLPEVFFTERSIGSASHYALNIEFLSELPSAALFTEYMFKDKQVFAEDGFKILHAPFFEVDPFKYGTRSDTVIVTSFEKKCILIAGTQYAGEIKKSMFSVMNYLTPLEGILPMHAGANQLENGECFAFFGLSGTGKTTLATEPQTLLIGDDEHGLSERGLFNFEGGCYAKTFRLSPETEPEIYRASTRFGSFLENVKMNHESHELDFFDSSITENGRSSYPLEFIEKRVLSGEGAIPKDIFFLCADAFGVMPAVSRLSLQQAVDHFILGYTAKVAGTEMGVKTPKATFSPCFGAPFMLRHPMEYAKLFAEILERHHIQVWLINTGWRGGAYGQGQRFPLPITRDIVRAIQHHELEAAEFEVEPIFGLHIPRKIRTLDETTLNPLKSWRSEEEYRTAAEELRALFENQLGLFRH